MTTLKDFLFDLAVEVRQEADKASEDGQALTDGALEDIVEEYLENIKNRLIG